MTLMLTDVTSHATIGGMTTTYGWCGNPAHGGHDHIQLSTCIDFVSDADHTRQLLAEARKHDAHVTYSPEAAYVATYRPY
jgi:hypothetical protein